MIDIHCHIIPLLDDGSQSMEDTLLMADQAIENGITSIIATPHHQTARFQNDAKIVLKKVAEVNRLLSENGKHLTIYPGQEIRLYPDLVTDLNQGSSLPLASSEHPYVLIEFPADQIPMYAEKVTYDLLNNGYIPVIAHPERNSSIVEDPEKLYKLVSQGCLSQVTAASVAGVLSKKVQRISFQLIEASLVHFVASDAHNTTSRGFYNLPALTLIEDKFGNSSYFLDNARKVLTGDPICPDYPEKVKKNSLLLKLFRK
ncbi:tyrosine-protein phosphatase [Jeotgalibacillus sp. R-1-5s-1]|uniref:tyrosine-protein phosphatase n=1 Tax=Jeotgalibacillus sp. R-1-5s-1 TaxID=2555897 RepID=UPI00106CD417|nr:CpsB/CapC family capsule biosynthesis tyrosine phosphatase [Jeotgalibacillus sp. R-1-5s-1]TFD97094.1 tyrosine protein phosphatase [Jeotgalibacillus sp. R-1-5s-1]